MGGARGRSSPGYDGQGVWDLAAALSGAVTSHDVALAVAEHGAAAAGASFSNLALYDEETGRLTLTHPARLDPAMAQRWRECGVDHRTPLGSVVVLGRPVWLRDLRAIASEYPALLDDTVRAGLTATASLPLKAADGSVLGAMGFGWAEPQGFADAQVGRLSLIAEVTGQALDRALLYEREHKHLAAVEQAQADLLQHAFLPTRLPATPGLEVAGAHLSAGAPMGGDWYDVFAVEGGTCLVIGDVAGHGLSATGVMAELRNAIRAYACDDPVPSRIVARTNAMLCRLEPETTATAIVAVWDPVSGTLRRANAGHPPPLRCRTGQVAFLEPPGEHRLLGAISRQTFVDEDTTLHPGTTLLCYTDGLIEDRDASLSDGMANLQGFVGSLGDLAPDALCRAVVAWRGQAERDDDVCVLAVRVAERRS